MRYLCVPCYFSTLFVRLDRADFSHLPVKAVDHAAAVVLFVDFGPYTQRMYRDLSM